MNEQIFIRLALLDDANAIAQQTAEVQRLHYEAMPESFRAPHDDLFPPDKLYALLKDPNVILAVAEFAGDVAGHVYGQVMHSGSVFRHREAAIYIHQIGVREDARGKGIGSALIAHVEERANALGISAIGLDHWAFNTDAKRFFEARGFAQSQVKMRKELSNQRR